MKQIEGYCKECKEPFSGFIYSKTYVRCRICSTLLLAPTGGKAKVVGLIVNEKITDESSQDTAKE